MVDSQRVEVKLISYASDPWNFLDIAAITTYFVGLVLRFVPITVCGTCFYASRIIFAFNHMLFFFRILNMFAVHPELGPKLVMIGKMVRFHCIIHLEYTVLRTMTTKILRCNELQCSCVCNVSGK